MSLGPMDYNYDSVFKLANLETRILNLNAYACIEIFFSNLQICGILDN